MPRVPLRGRRSARRRAAVDEETRAHVAGAASAAAAEVDAPPAVAPDRTAAAFFDVDNTMMMGASIFQFARGLAARKFFTDPRHGSASPGSRPSSGSPATRAAPTTCTRSARTRWRSSPAGRSPRSCRPARRSTTS